MLLARSLRRSTFRIERQVLAKGYSKEELTVRRIPRHTRALDRRRSGKEREQPNGSSPTGAASPLARLVAPWAHSSCALMPPFPPPNVHTGTLTCATLDFACCSERSRSTRTWEFSISTSPARGSGSCRGWHDDRRGKAWRSAAPAIWGCYRSLEKRQHICLLRGTDGAAFVGAPHAPRCAVACGVAARAV